MLFARYFSRDTPETGFSLQLFFGGVGICGFSVGLQVSVFGIYSRAAAVRLLVYLPYSRSVCTASEVYT